MTASDVPTRVIAPMTVSPPTPLIPSGVNFILLMILAKASPRDSIRVAGDVKTRVRSIPATSVMTIDNADNANTMLTSNSSVFRARARMARPDATTNKAPTNHAAITVPRSVSGKTRYRTSFKPTIIETTVDTVTERAVIVNPIIHHI